MHKALVFWGVCAVLVFVPLPIGSVEPWAVFVFEAATLALFLIYWVGEYAARRRERGRGRAAAGSRAAAGGRGAWRVTPTPRFSGPPETGLSAGERDDRRFGTDGLPRAVKILLAVFVAVSVLQILPLPHAVVGFLSPRAASIYQGMAREGLGGWNVRSPWTLSLAPLVSAGELLLLLCYGLFGFLVLRTVRTRRRIEIFVLVVIASALFQAFYGMAETFSGSEKIFGYQKRYNIGSVTGTYINRNHLAGFLEMAFPLSLGYLLSRARFFLMERGLGWRQKFLWFSQESLQWSLLFGLGTVFIAVALIFSKSRSGILILLVTVLLAAAAFGGWRELSERTDERKRMRGILRVIVAAVVGAALWLGIGPVIDRFAEMDVSKQARRTFMLNTARMTGDFLWTGAGKGTFLYAYPMYKRVDDGLQLSYAHNDYLEVVAENGLIAGGCLIAAGFWLLVFLAGKWRKRRANFAKGVGLGAILGIAALLIHGFTDFNLQIPANAVYFVGLCMLALNVVGKGRAGGRPTEQGAGEATARSAVADALEVKAARARSGKTRNAESTGGLGNAGEYEAMPVPGANGPNRNPAGPSLWKTLVGAVLAVALLFVACRQFLGYYELGRYKAARESARSIQADFGTLDRLVTKAAGAWPNAGIEEEAGRLCVEMARAENEAGEAMARDKLCDEAVARYTAVLRMSPLDSSADYEMGMTYLLYNYPLMTYADKAKLYFRKALEINPSDEFLNLNILFFYLTSWQGLTGDEKDYAADRLRRLRAADAAFMPQLEQRWRKQFGSLDGLTAILPRLD
jgi:tetratricopeptide (TPR) repeat protein